MNNQPSAIQLQQQISTQGIETPRKKASNPGITTNQDNEYYDGDSINNILSPTLGGIDSN